MATRTARTAWNGTLHGGQRAGRADQLRRRHVRRLVPRVPPTRLRGRRAPRSSSPPPTPPATPWQLAGGSPTAGGTPIALEVTADVTLRPRPGRRPAHHPIHLTVRGEVEGLDADGFQAAAEAAKAGCPVSKALTGTEITLDAALD